MKTRVPLALASLLISIVACNGLPSTGPALSTPGAEAAPTAVPSANVSDVADIVFINGAVITLDDATARAQALAVRGDTILTVGANEEVNSYRGPGTIVIDLAGKTLLPGFIDSHQYRIQKHAQVGVADAPSIIQAAIEQGLTSIHELYVDGPLLDELLALDGQGALRLRVDAYLPFMQYDAAGTSLGDWYKAYHQGQMLSPHVRVAGLIGFVDYDNANVLLWKQDDLNAFLLQAQREGWSVAWKTVSTRSLEMLLDAYEQVETVEPNVVKSRGRLEHALFITPDQIGRIKRLGLVPVINLNNPGQLVGEADIDALITREPQGSYTPWRALEQAGIPVASGSGWPSYYVDEPAGAPFGSPLHLLFQGVTRLGNLGKAPYPWLLDQTITAQDALRALTINSAYAAFEEQSKGSLRTGKLADLVVLSDDPLGVPPDQVNNIQVLMTMIGGKVEYCAAGSQALCPLASPAATMPASTTQASSSSATAQASYPSATASRSLPDNPPSNAIDGDPDTAWIAGDQAEQWILVDLGQPVTVSAIRLLISQYPSGETVHQIWVGLDANSLALIHEFRGVTSEPGTLEFNPSSPLTNIRYLKVVTTLSPSWVSWREIEIIRAPGG